MLLCCVQHTGTGALCSYTEVVAHGNGAIVLCCAVLRAHGDGAIVLCAAHGAAHGDGAIVLCTEVPIMEVHRGTADCANNPLISQSKTGKCMV